MTDQELRGLERQATEDPSARKRLEAAWIRRGLGWFGERLPRTLQASPRRGIYTHVDLPGLEFVFVQAQRESDSFHAGRFPVLVSNWHAYHERPWDPVWALDLWAHNPYAELELRPVTDVSPEEVATFCRLMRVSLPTLEEWNRIAFGGPDVLICAEHLRPAVRELEDGDTELHSCQSTWIASPRRPGERNLYPWGNDEPDLTRVATTAIGNHVGGFDPGACICRKKLGRFNEHYFHQYACTNNALERGIFPERPAGASWCGALELFGNVLEMTCDGLAGSTVAAAIAPSRFGAGSEVSVVPGQSTTSGSSGNLTIVGGEPTETGVRTPGPELIPGFRGWRNVGFRVIATLNDECVNKADPVEEKAVATGRNDLCACGSGKKFKRCCMT